MAVGLTKDRLCIVTPDTFYAVLLGAAEFPTFDIKVIKGIDQLPSLAVSFMPDAFLLFSDHLGPAVLSRTVIEIRSKFRGSDLFQVEGVRDPKVSLLWSSVAKHSLSLKALDASSVEAIDGSMRQLLEPNLVGLKTAKAPTKTQLELLKALAVGTSNQEIAGQRETTVRAVETLMKRALNRIGAGECLNARSKIVLAQKYLASQGLDF